MKEEVVKIPENWILFNLGVAIGLLSRAERENGFCSQEYEDLKNRVNATLYPKYFINPSSGVDIG